MHSNVLIVFSYFPRIPSVNGIKKIVLRVKTEAGSFSKATVARGPSIEQGQKNNTLKPD